MRGTERPAAVLKTNLGGREMSMGQEAMDAAVLTVELHSRLSLRSNKLMVGLGSSLMPDCLVVPWT